MLVMKFGGTSVGNADRIREACEIVSSQRTENEGVVVVVSAISGITNKLQDLYQKKEKNLSEIRKMHDDIISELNLDMDLAGIYDELQQDLDENNSTDESKAKIMSYGERMSSHIISKYFESQGLSNQRLTGWSAGILTDSAACNAEVMEESYNTIPKNFEEEKLYVVTGYIARDKDWNITLLGRGGSDYTATIIGSALDAREIQIWTDVDGMLSTDPKMVPEATRIEKISYEEAGELAYFGAKVLHPKTLRPAQIKNIPVKILNSTNPEATGTTIMQNGSSTGVRAIAFKEDITTIRICSSRMLGARGFLARIFEVFAKHGMSIDVVTTSEVTVSVTVDKEANLERVVSELETFSRVTVQEGKAILCVVGPKLYENVFIPSKVLSCLAEQDIHVEMISQGASSVNITCVVKDEVLEQAVKSLHKEFFAGGTR